MDGPLGQDTKQRCANCARNASRCSLIPLSHSFFCDYPVSPFDPLMHVRSFSWMSKVTIGSTRTNVIYWSRCSLEVLVLAGLDPAVVHCPETPAGSMKESGLFYNRRTQGCSVLQGVLQFMAFRNHTLRAKPADNKKNKLFPLLGVLAFTVFSAL